MPRIAPRLIRQAGRYSADVATLLPACKDLDSAFNELRWIKNHVHETTGSLKPGDISRLCQRRNRGEPLQYILGTQPFGHLDIKCKSGVLIPRSETEAYTCHLIDLVKSGGISSCNSGKPLEQLNIIDFCSGTGCIPLLLFASLYRLVSQLNVRGMDISKTAVQLCLENLDYNVRGRLMPRPTESKTLSFARGDIFKIEDIEPLTRSNWHVMTANPPYISPDVWKHGRGQLGYSVRKYEPRLALVPPERVALPLGCRREDIFYSRLLDVAGQLNPGLVLMEVGGEDQGRRVIEMFRQHSTQESFNAELWRDWPGQEPVDNDASCANGLPIRGVGSIRAVVLKSVAHRQ